MTIAPQTLKQLCGATRQAITTKSYPDGEGGWEIRVSCDARKAVVPWNALLGVQENHAAAALLLLAELGWQHDNHLVAGSVSGDSYVFVQVPPRDWPTEDLEYAVDDCSGKERVFKTPDEAAGFAVAVAMSGKSDVNIDVLCWTREAAVRYQGEEFAEQWEEDPNASVSDRVRIRAESLGRVP